MTSEMKQLVVVGNGMAGIACVEQILKHAPQFEITVFGDETHVNYNRILLSSVLAGEKAADEIMLNPLEWYQQQRHRSCASACGSSTSIPTRSTVTGDDGSVTPYDTLLLATGSSRLHAADRRARQGRRLRVPHARRHPRAARRARGRA